MKTLHLVRICVGVLVVISILAFMIHPKVLATEDFCDQHFDHGPTLGETIGKGQCENPTTQMIYDRIAVMTHDNQKGRRVN